MSDLEAAILNVEQALSAIPKDHPNQARGLDHLGTMLSDRYNQTGDMDDLEAAISKAEMAPSATPEHHPDRVGRPSNLANMRLLSR